MEQLKTCRTCGIEKATSEYHKDSGKKLGIRNECKSCAKQTSHSYYLKNTNRITDRVSKYSKSYIPRHSRKIDSKLRNLFVKARARKNKEFNILEDSLIELWDKQQGLCAYTKLPMLATSNQFNTVSLDRIDSNIGYVVGNIQLVCTAVNKMKQEYSPELFIKLCHLVAQNNSIKDYPESLALIP